MAKKIVDETLKFDIIINGDKAKKEYGQLTRENRKLLSANQDLEEQAKKLEKANKESSQEYARLRSEIEQNNRVVQQNEARIKDLTEEIGINNLSMRQLRREAGKLSGIMSNLDPQSETWREYNTQLQSVSARMANLRQEMKPVEESMDEQLETIGKLSSGFGQFFTTIGTGDYRSAAQGLGTIRDGINQATAAALKFIATPIGAVIAVLAGIGYAAKEWLNYNQAVTESIRLTEEITRLQGEQAHAVRLQAEAIEETYGVEFKETLETARNLSRQFNISFTEALDEIEAGLIKGQKNNNEYFDSLKEYGTFFSSAGFSVDEFRKIIEKGYDLGVYSDKLPDAIKEFDLSMREQTKSTREALVNAFGAAFTDDLLGRVKRGETTTKEALQEIAAESERTGLNMQQYAQLTADVFRGAGEDVGGANKILNAFNQSLNESEGVLTPLQQRIKDVAEANKELAEAQDQALRSDNYLAMANSLELFWKKVKTLFFQGLRYITDGLSVVNEKLTIWAFQTMASIQALPTLARESFKEFITEVWDVVQALGGLGDVAKNVLSFNFEGAKASYKDFKALLKKEISEAIDVGEKYYSRIEELRATVKKNVEQKFADQRAAASDPEPEVNEPQEGDIKIIDGVTYIFKNGQWQVKKTGGVGGGNEDELTAEEKAKLASRKRLYELLDQMEEERALQDQLKQIEKDQRNEEEEVLRIESKFQKLAEQANGEADLLARLEQEKENQIQAVRDKYAKSRLEKEEAAKKKLVDMENEFKRKLIEAEDRLVAARRNAANTGLNILQGFVGKSTALGKALFVVQKGLAVSNIIAETAKSISSIISNTAIANSKATAQFPLTAGQPWVGINTATAAKNIAATKINAATQIGRIVAETVKGFEQGLYPVKRDDGRIFNARYGGSPRTQVVPVPTHFIAGETKPEMIIDGDTFRRMDPAVTDYILGLAGKKVSGFESGVYPGTRSNEDLIAAVNATLAMLNERLSQPISAQILYGPEASRRQQEYDEKIRSVRQNAKIRQNVV